MSMLSKKCSRRILIVRHAQRVDRYLREAYATVGKEWTKECFQNNDYQQLNIEMPLNIPQRNPLRMYEADPPLTTMGELCSQLTGNRMAELGIRLDIIYSSPALRCIQTAQRMIQGYIDYAGQTDLPIRIESGLYEYQGFASEGIPQTFCSFDFLSQRGIITDSNYK